MNYRKPLLEYNSKDKMLQMKRRVNSQSFSSGYVKDCKKITLIMFIR